VSEEKKEEPGIIWKENADGDWRAFILDPETSRRKEAVWAPQPGSQEAFIACPVREVLYTGMRGPGKTDALLADFAQHVGKGFKSAWTGILFRQTYPELQDVIKKSKEWFPRIWPEAKYNESKYFWTWPDGERLLLRHAKTVDDYNHYHGHEYPWIGWEELTNWANPAIYLKMISVNRCSKKGVPIKYRATCNPSGPGHNWVKDRWRLPVAMGLVVGPVIIDSRDRSGGIEHPRVAIHGHLMENKVLLHANPDYLQSIRSSADNDAQLRAWVYGDWDIVAGGMFDDLWRANIHVVPNLPFGMIPLGWKIDRSYDHGQSKPFSVGWWAESNGEPVTWNGRIYGQVRGDIYRIGEWYGWNGRPNEGIRMLSSDIAQGILDREDDWNIRHRVRAGPADSSIFDDIEPGKSVAGDMKKPPLRVKWTPADKRPGSRIQGWQQMRKMLRGAMPSSTGLREEPGLFVFERCLQFQRTVPALSRDGKNPDDVDTDIEDHIGDETRYRLRAKNSKATIRNF